MKKRKNTNQRRPTQLPTRRYAIFYKSHGCYIGPYAGVTLTGRDIQRLVLSGELNELSNYVLRSPLQLRTVLVS